MKRLSVIIPGYNTPDALWARCIQSVAAACCPDDEIICVDDGSKIKPSIVNLNLKSYPHIKWLYIEKNVGQAVARNKALDIAQGQYVTFVDSDDAVTQDGHYGSCIQSLEEQDADVAVYGVNVVWKAEGLQKVDLPKYASIDDLHKRNLFNYPINKVIRRSFLEKTNIRFIADAMPCEDVIFNLDLVLNNAKWVVVPVVGYVYYLRTNGSQVTSYDKRSHKALLQEVDKWRQYVAMHPDASAYIKNRILSEAEILWDEWVNICKQGSPYSFVERLRWLRANAHKMSVSHPVLLSCMTVVKMFVRRHFYLRVIRRWNLRRLYDNVEEIK